MKMNIKLMLLQVSAFIICAVQYSSAVETPEPAALLQPRDFNPHPYENGRVVAPTVLTRLPNKNLRNPGPVQFPSSNGNALRKLPHPYAKVSQKARADYGRDDRDYNRPIYENDRYHTINHLEQDEALAASSQSKKHYAFSYTVKDHHSGDDFSHTQQQTDGTVHGSYKVQLPDGRTQIVKYTADDNGYRADVSYDLNHETSPQDTHHYHQEPPAVVETPPPSPTLPSPTQYHEHQHHHHEPEINVSPSPALLSAKPLYEYFKNLHLSGKPYLTDNEQLFQNGGYDPVISSTPTPYLISSTFSPSNYHEVESDHVNINDFSTGPLDQSNSHHHHHHQHHHHQSVQSTIVPYFSNPKPGLIAKLVPIPSHPRPSEYGEDIRYVSPTKATEIYHDDGPVKHNLPFNGYGSDVYHHGDSNGYGVGPTPSTYYDYNRQKHSNLYYDKN